MTMSHDFYIGASYAVAAIVILCLIAWVWLDGRARRRELAELEASGIRRRSSVTTSAGSPEGTA
jgi:heme exporter protein D